MRWYRCGGAALFNTLYAELRCASLRIQSLPLGDTGTNEMTVALLRFDPRAPRLVRITALLMLTGSVFEAFWMFGSRWPAAHGPLDLWRATVSPLILIGLSILLANALARLVSWAYWLTVLLWVPFVFLGVLVVVASAFRQPSSGLALTAFDLMGYAAVGCYVAAALLLVTNGCRNAFRGNTPGAAGRVT